MTSPTPSPDEDALATALADAAIALVEESHPTAPPVFRRRMARLYLRQLTGSEKPPGQIAAATVARSMGVSKQRGSEIQAVAIAKLYRAILDRHPELLP